MNGSEEKFSPQSWDSGLYQDKHSFVWEYASSLVDLLAPQKGERILDLGCGTGQLTAKIADSGAEVIGLDKAPTMIQEARRLYPQLHFDLGDAHDFSYTEPFDAVFSNAALHWITRPEKVVEGVRAVLKPQGRLVVEFGGKGNVQHLVNALETASLRVLGKAILHPWYFPSVEEFASLLEGSDLEVIQAALFDRPTPLEGEEGLRNWVKMFGSHWLEQIPEERRTLFFEQLEELARLKLFRDGKWYADYCRLRVVAVKKEMAKRNPQR